MHIREAIPSDLSLIRDLAEKIWPGTYSSIISQAQIRYMLDKMYDEGELQQQMKKGDRFLLLYDNNEPSGFASVGQTGPGIFKLHKLYVLDRLQGKGAGKLLLQEAERFARLQGGSTLSLNVNRDNKARFFYEKMGFAITREIDLDIGNGFFMNDFIMEKGLGSGGS